KRDETRKLLPIKRVAQAAGFYANDVEKSLSEDVELPGNDVIDKIRGGVSIDETDWRHLTYYIATMIRRVPSARGKAYAMVPEVLTEMVGSVKDFFRQEHREGRINAETLA